MAERTLRSFLPPEYEGKTLLDYVSGRFGYREREEWAAEIEAGCFAVNGEPASSEMILHRDDEVAYTAENHSEPEVDREIQLLHADADLLVINKPGNLPVHASGAYHFNTLVQVLIERGYGTLGEEGEKSTIHVAHRLDRETSGVILVARNKEAKAHLSRQFDEGTVSKVYHAIVYGDVEEDAFTVEKPLLPDESSRFRSFYRTAEGEEAGPPSRTDFKTLIRYGGYTLIEAVPHTGRPHQIRVHLASAGYPVVGDKKYLLGPEGFDDFVNNRRREELRRFWVTPRHMLHALSIDFRHPQTDLPWHAEAGYPEDMKNFMKRLQLLSSSSEEMD